MTEPINLDELRAERGESPRRPIILNGTTYHVRARLTVPLAIAAVRGDLPELVAGLFGPDAEAVLAEEPPLEVADLRAMVEALGGPGNLRGSTGS